MKDLLLPLLHLAVTAAKLCRPGGVRAVIAENLLLKQQLIVLRRSRQRAPNLRVGDRLLCGFGALFLSPGRIRKVAIGRRPSTLLTFHQALVRGKYRRLFSSSARPKKPGPKGPSESTAEELGRALLTVDTRARHALARDVADRFDQYLYFRPEMIAAWDRGEAWDALPESAQGDEAWQRDLWRRLSGLVRTR